MSSTTISTSLSPGGVYCHLQDKSAEAIQSIVTDNVGRRDYKQDISLLEKGVFYPYDYYKALHDAGSTKRLDFFKEKDSFLHGYAPPKHFTMITDDSSFSGKKVAAFALRKGVLPSAALKAISEGLTFTGCGEACQIAQYAAIESALGTSKFDALFASDGPTPLIIGSKAPNNPISRLRNYLMIKNPSEPEIKKGDQIFIENTPSYFNKHPIGAASGYNTICIDDTVGSQKFTTLGLSGTGSSREEIAKSLVDEHNKPFKNLESLSEKMEASIRDVIGRDKMKKADEFKDHKISLDDFKKLDGGKITIVCELDAKRITALASSSIEEAKRLLAGYDARVGQRLSETILN